ncbi:MAG: hypothetical protein JXP34_12725 [Planctomycetes bacterium]|nr:hypothetical protein [Planctomycetota bacterium]
MKVVVSLLATVTICLGGLLGYQVVSLDGRIERLEGQISVARAPAGEPSAIVKASFSDDPALTQRLSDLGARIAQLEQAARREASAGPAPEAPAEPPQARGPRGAFAAGVPNAGGGRRGANADAMSLFRMKDEEMTPEQIAQRDQMREQFRQRAEEQAAQRIQSTIDGFDGTLQTRLSTQQRLELQQILEAEQTARRDMMTPGQGGGTFEERRAQMEAARAAVDQQVQRILSAEQYQGWVSYRAQNQQTGRMGGPGGTRGAFGGGTRGQAGPGGRGGRGGGG